MSPGHVRKYPGPAKVFIWDQLQDLTATSHSQVNELFTGRVSQAELQTVPGTARDPGQAPGREQTGLTTGSPVPAGLACTAFCKISSSICMLQTGVEHAEAKQPMQAHMLAGGSESPSRPFPAALFLDQGWSS